MVGMSSSLFLLCFPGALYGAPTWLCRFFGVSCGVYCCVVKRVFHTQSKTEAIQAYCGTVSVCCPYTS